MADFFLWRTDRKLEKEFDREIGYWGGMAQAIASLTRPFIDTTIWLLVCKRELKLGHHLLRAMKPDELDLEIVEDDIPTGKVVPP